MRRLSRGSLVVVSILMVLGGVPFVLAATGITWSNSTVQSGTANTAIVSVSCTTSTDSWVATFGVQGPGTIIPLGTPIESCSAHSALVVVSGSQLSTCGTYTAIGGGYNILGENGGGLSGSSFTVTGCSTGTGVPEFPFGLLALVAVLIPIALVVRRIRMGRATSPA